MKFINAIVLSFIIVLTFSCKDTSQENESATKIPVIFDTDANNELDDQHAMAYLLFNQDIFDIKGITVNATYNGGGIDEHYAEAERVLKLCVPKQDLPLLKGAEGKFLELKDQATSDNFDGSEAVNFIIEEANKHTDDKLVVLAVGKLTNVATAIVKDPNIVSKIKLVWLGSNIPNIGEYNLENDVEAMNYLLSNEVEFEIVVCRYGEPSGTDAVRVTPEQINEKMPKTGPKAKSEVSGRHGGTFTYFGDYSVNLFEHAEMHGNPPSRALFDMAAVAVLKDLTWAERIRIGAPIMINGEWLPIDDNPRKIIIWQNFNKEMIINDFFNTMTNAN